MEPRPRMSVIGFEISVPIVLLTLQNYFEPRVQTSDMLDTKNITINRANIDCRKSYELVDTVILSSFRDLSPKKVFFIFHSLAVSFLVSHGTFYERMRQRPGSTFSWGK